MDEQNTKKTINEHYSGLPADLKRLIISPEIGQILSRIALTYGLDRIQTIKFKNETMFILFGMEPIDHYLTNLVEEAGIDQATAQKITFDVDVEIFSRVFKTLESLAEELWQIELALSEEEDSADTPASQVRAFVKQTGSDSIASLALEIAKNKK